MSDARDYGPMLAAAREARGWSQSHLALLVGATGGAVSHWETGRYLPKPRHALAVERVLGVPAAVAHPDVWPASDETAA